MTDEKSTEVAAGSGRPRWLILAIVLVCVLAIGVAIGLVIGAENEADDDVEAAAPVTDAAPQSAARPVAPAPAGEELTDVATPPSETLAMVDAATLKADALYEVRFSPFGYGPTQGGSGLVVRLSEAIPVNSSAEAFDFVGRNVLASVVPGGVEITEGGTYTATLAFRPNGDMLAPVLRDVAVGQ